MRPTRNRPYLNLHGWQSPGWRLHRVLTVTVVAACLLCVSAQAHRHDEPANRFSGLLRRARIGHRKPHVSIQTNGNLISNAGQSAIAHVTEPDPPTSGLLSKEEAIQRACEFIATVSRPPLPDEASAELRRFIEPIYTSADWPSSILMPESQYWLEETSANEGRRFYRPIAEDHCMNYPSGTITRYTRQPMSTNKTYGALLKTLLILRPPNKSHDVLTIKHEHMEDPTHALTQHHLKITWFIEPTACDVSSLTYDITQDGRIALSATRRGPIGNGIVSYLDYFGGHDPSGNWVEQVSSSSPERGYLLMFPE